MYHHKHSRGVSSMEKIKSYVMNSLAGLAMLVGSYATGQTTQSTQNNNPIHQEAIISQPEEQTPIELHSTQDTQKPNALIMLTRDHGGLQEHIYGVNEDGSFDQSVMKIKEKYDTFIALVDHPDDFKEAHKQASEKYGTLDLLYMDGHAHKTQVQLSPKYRLEIMDIFGEDYSEFYSDSAKGILGQCLTASKDIPFNFAQVLADVINAPVQGATTTVRSYLNDELNLEEALSEQEGFNPTTKTGNFLSNNGVLYTLKKTPEEIKVLSRGFTRDFKGSKEDISWEVPKDYSPEAVYHTSKTPNSNNFRTVYPN